MTNSEERRKAVTDGLALIEKSYKDLAKLEMEYEQRKEQLYYDIRMAKVKVETNCNHPVDRRRKEDGRFYCDICKREMQGRL